MKIFSGLNNFFNYYVKGYFINRISHFSQKIILLVNRIKTVVCNWIDKESAEAQKMERQFALSSELAKKRIEVLHRNFNCVLDFLTSKPKLREAFQKSLPKFQEMLEIRNSARAMAKALSRSKKDSCLSIHFKSIKNAHEFQLLWNNFFRVLDKSPEMKKSFVEHIRELQRTVNTNATDKHMLSMLNELPQELQADIYQH